MLAKHRMRKLGLALVATVALGVATATNAEARFLGGFGGFHGFGGLGGFRGAGFGFRGAGLGYRGPGWGWGGLGAAVVAGSVLGAASSYGYPSYPAYGDYGYSYPSYGYPVYGGYGYAYPAYGYPTYGGYSYSYPAYGYPAYGSYGGFRGAYARGFGGAAFASGHRFAGVGAGFGRVGRVHAGRRLRR